MESNYHLLLVTKSEKDAVWKEFGITETKMQQSVDHLLDWHKLQQHFPAKLPDESCLKTLLVANKMSIEKVKSKLDMKYTLKGLTPELFLYSDLFKSGLKEITNNVYWIPLPKLTADLARVNILKIVGSSEKFSLVNHFKRSFMYADHRLHSECCLADRFILDLEHLEIGHFTKINPLVIKKSEIASSKVYGLRVAGIHILNAPPIVDKLLTLLKQILKPKLADRIVVHPDYEHLYKHINREILPKEYGGDERSLETLNDEWYKEITSENIKKMLLEEENLKSNESKRLIAQVDEDILGIQGSFRKLDFD